MDQDYNIKMKHFEESCRYVLQILLLEKSIE